MRPVRECACAATLCRATVQRGQVFCPDHYWSLPEAVRRAIPNAFRAGQFAVFREAVAEARDLIDAREFQPLFPGEAA
ncbi:hypothetical protein D1610_11490 [Sphingomonas gilva]|uniref:Uncharacterized protein n=2 Tax=Sphingomonas gilva TaxID=2305907 RepID=A0A396S1B2_9SPHN|nr:hypothetical protein D1610_11490 [Sphingomonas gilva]